MTFTTTAKTVLVMFLWAVCFPLIVAGFAYAPHLIFAALRAFLAGAVLIAAGVLLGRPWPRGGRIWLAICGVGLGATTFGYFGMFMASEYVSPGIATVLANSQPIMAAVFAAVFLGEHLGWRGKTGLGLGFAGIALIAEPMLLTPAAGDQGLGIAYILIAALGITFSNVLIRAVANRVDPLMAMGAQLLIGGVPLLGLSLVFEDVGSLRPAPQFLLVLGVLGVFGSSLAYWLWVDILRTTELSRANSFAFLVPLFGLTMGSAYFGETLLWVQIAGIVVTICGVALTNARSIRAPVIAPAPAPDREGRRISM